MKFARIKVELELDVPYDGWDDDGIRFDVNENSCIGTGMPGMVMDKMQEWGMDTNSCWGCIIQKDMQLLEIMELSTEDIEREYPWLSESKPDPADPQT